MKDVFPEGPVRESVKFIKYSPRVEGKSELPITEYSYPGGSRERFEDYGDYFSVHWSPGPSLSQQNLVESLFKIPQIENSPSGFDVVSRDGSNEIIDKVEQMDDIESVFAEFDSKRESSYALSAGIGTFFWEVGPEGQITNVGVLTYNGAPVESIVSWQNMTAHPEIIQRKNSAIEPLLPPESDET